MSNTSLLERTVSASVKGVKGVRRGASGELIGWIENGCSMSIERSTQFSLVTLVLQLGSVVERCGYSFDGSGYCVSTSGQNIPTVFSGEIVRTGVTGIASGGGGGGGTSVSSAPATNIVTDSSGRPLTYTVAGVSKTVSYGQYGVSTITGSDGNVESYSYDAAGNLTGIVNSNGSNASPSGITLDTDGTTLTFVVSGVTYTLTYITNAKGKQINTITGGGHVTTYSYDGSGNFTGSTTV